MSQKTLTHQYLDLLQDCMRSGNNTVGRNGLVRKLWAPAPLVVRDVSSDFPYLQNRPTAFYKSVLETLFFLSGDSSYESMPEALCTSWWKPWASVAHDQKSWGRFYSTQWRAQVTETPGVYFDALKHLLQQMLEVITSGVENRKMVVSLWHTPDTLVEYTRKPAVLESCLPAHTKVLTKRGWKPIAEVSVGEEVWASDSELRGVWAHVTKTHAFMDQEVGVYSNSNWTIEATEDHRWYGLNQTFKPGFRTSAEVAGKPFKIPARLVPKAWPLVSVLTQDEARLLGWLLSDGNWEKNFSKGSIKQAKPKTIRVIDRLLTRMDVQYSWSEKYKTFHIPARVVKPLLEKAFGYVPLKTQCSVSGLLHRLGKKELRSLLITMIQAEGSIKPGGTYCIYQSVKSPIAEDIKTMMVLTGIGCTAVAKPPRPQAFGIEDCYTYTPRVSKFFTLPPKTSQYNADVYCLTTTTGTFLVEQNNKTFLSGNCHSTSLVFDLELGSSGWSLNLHHTQRSLDLVNGTAADLVYSGLVMELVARYLEARTSQTVMPGRLVFCPVNVHVYSNHWEGVMKHLEEEQPDLREYGPTRLIHLTHNPLSRLLQGSKPKTIEEAKEWFYLRVKTPATSAHKFTLNA